MNVHQDPLTPLPWNSEKEFYDLHSQIIFSSTRFYCVTFVGHTDEEFLEHIVRKGRISPGMKVLDLGCGSGYLVKELSEFGCECLGISTSEKCIVQCRENYPTAHFEQGDMQDFNWSGTSCCLALESIGYADRRLVFQNVYRNLIPGGILYMTDLFKCSHENRKAEENRKSWEFYWKYSAMTVEDTIKTAVDCGLTLLEYNYLSNINVDSFRRTLELNLVRYRQPHRQEEFVDPGEMIFIKKA